MDGGSSEQGRLGGETANDQPRSPPLGGSGRPNRVVFHLDMDAFYASVEQRDRPELHGKPVVIGADPEEGRGRGVVAAASYEAREHGIHSAMPISRAWRACPHAVYLRPNFDKYGRVSDQVMELLAERVDVLEVASIDEAYADVTRTTRTSFRRAEALARTLKGLVQEELSLTCSIGVGPNKLVAKVASDLDKPNGLTVVPPDRVADVLGPLSARVIPGVGPKTGELLGEHGIETVAELARVDPRTLQDWLGSWGPDLHRFARGLDDRPVRSEWERKSAGAETTFASDLSPDEAWVRLEDVVAEAVERLRSEGEQARTVTLKVRLDDFETFTRARTLPAPTDEPATVLTVARELFDQASPERPVRLLGVRLSGLTRQGPHQATLDAWPAGVLGEADLPEPRGRWFT